MGRNHAARRGSKTWSMDKKRKKDGERAQQDLHWGCKSYGGTVGIIQARGNPGGKDITMFVLEYKQLFIPREELTKNRCFQGYRWKQYALCAEKEPLVQILAEQKRQEDWRIVEMPGNIEPEG